MFTVKGDAGSPAGKLIYKRFKEEEESMKKKYRRMRDAVEKERRAKVYIYIYIYIHIPTESLFLIRIHDTVSYQGMLYYIGLFEV